MGCDPNGMQTATLGPLTVSRLALGAMLFGEATPEDESHRMLDRFLEAGGTLIDTADVYGDGRSERVLAPWLARHRDEVVLATKLRFPVSDPGGQGLAPDRIRAACDASLRRLGVDVIDLYQVHAPDPAVPLEETLEALDGLVRAGKVRALGASNYPAWLLAWAVALQDRNGWSPFVSLQPQYSLVERSAELDLLPVHARRRARRAAVGAARRRLPDRQVPAWRAAARGQPDGERGRRLGGGASTGARSSATSGSSTRPPRSPARTGPRSRRWRWRGCSASRASPRRSSGRARSSTSRTLLGCVDVELSAEERARLEAPAPPPEVYPQRMLVEQSGMERFTGPLR